MAYVGTAHLAHSAFLSLMLSMIYRYSSIRFRHFSSKLAVCQCLIAYSCSFVILASCYNLTVNSNLEVNRKILGDVVKNLESYRMVVSTNVANQPALWLMISAVSVGLLPIYIIIFWCRRQIYKKLKETRSDHSAATKENVKLLVSALTIQSTIPLVSIFPAISFYCLSQLGLIDTSYYSYFIMPCVSVGCLADPLVTMRFILPYRRFILSLLGRRSGQSSGQKASQIMFDRKPSVSNRTSGNK